MSAASRLRVSERRWPEPARPEWLTNFLALNALVAVWNSKWQRWEVHGRELQSPKIYVSPTMQVEEFIRKAHHVTGELTIWRA